MFNSPSFRRLFLSYLLPILAAVLTVGGLAAYQLRAAFRERAEQTLRVGSQLAASLLADHLADPIDPADLAKEVRRLGEQMECRVTVVRDDGVVVADNEADPSRMENHRFRPEIVEASRGGEGSSLRSSSTVQKDLLYFARRMEGRGGKTYFLRLALPLRELDRRLATLMKGLALAALAALAASAAVSYVLARRRTAPLIELSEWARVLSRGNLSRRFPVGRHDEVEALADSLNTVADSLSDLQARTMKDEAQLLAIVSSMSEGVIATDTRQRVLLTNAAAADLLGFPEEGAEGRALWELVAQEPVLRAAGEALAGGGRSTFPLGPLLGRHLEVTACTFGPPEAPEGMVLVAHDVTRAVRYQTMRQEFVANVSHELRTPLSAIKGFAETLREGAMADPARGPRYLAIIEKHADQLANVIDDLLELSRLESRPDLPRCVAVDVRAVVQKAVETLSPVARKKRQQLDVDVAPGLPAVSGNADYLQRAVSNLIDNAIKYTPDEGRIAIGASAKDGHVTVTVADTGIGIPAEDLPRIFERFYRVDRSRSRDVGGTGLGLSIVKHVVQMHQGHVTVSSTPGRGSTFTLKLPVGVA